MSEPRYIQGYAVIRVDDGPVDNPARAPEWRIDGIMQPTAGPANVTVKQLVTTADEARREVVRLNAINAGKGCTYYWQPTHIFLNGGSHGSVGRDKSGTPRPA